MRLVPDQDYREIGRLFAEHFHSIAPRQRPCRRRGAARGLPVRVSDRSARLSRRRPGRRTDVRPEASAVLFGRRIPIISTFEKELGVKSVLLGFGLDRDAIHSPNESYGLENFLRGIETIVWFYREFAAGR